MSIDHQLQVHDLSGLHKTGVYGIVGANDGDGVTTAVAAVAKLISTQLSGRVLVVDANLQAPGLHKVFGVPQQMGLGDLLEDHQLEPADVTVSLTPGIDLITTGPETLSGLLGRQETRLTALISSFKDQYRHIVMDLGTPSQSPAIIGVSHLFDGLIIALCCQQTRWEVAQDLRDKLNAADANVLGIIMNQREYYIPRWLYRFV